MTLEGRDIAVEGARPIETIGILGLGRSGWRKLMSLFARAGIYYRFSTITGRIVALNFFSLMILVGGMFYLSDYRARLIAARGNSLTIEAEIIAKALALEGAPRASDSVNDALFGNNEGSYTISLETSAAIMRSLIEPTKRRNLKDSTETNGYIYSADGTLLVDSNRIYKSGKLTQYQNPTKRSDEVDWTYKFWLFLERQLRRESLPMLANIGVQNGKAFAEVKAALEEGSPTLIARENELGETILNYAAPIEKGDKVLGALLLTTGDGEIDELIRRERADAAWMFLFVLFVTVGGSLVLAGTIAGPMQRLAQAAEQVRNNVKTRTGIPDFSHRSDEIGYLARALKEMTSALYARLEAIENFAADVAHELKNPLTSLHSAADTLPLVKNDEDRNRLIKVVRHDVQRLNRLITDISDASRLDVELAREGRSPVNIVALLDSICAAQQDIHRECAVKIDFQIKGVPRAFALARRSPFMVYGHEGRLSQVICNLLDNAISFSPENGRVRIICNMLRRSKELEIAVEDDGPGIPEDNLEKIFDRFYTYRPGQDEFGKNSGLGLNISRQIINAHKGRIWAENLKAPPTTVKTEEQAPARVIGARFVILLPVIGRDS